MYLFQMKKANFDVSHELDEFLMVETLATTMSRSETVLMTLHGTAMMNPHGPALMYQHKKSFGRGFSSRFLNLVLLRYSQAMISMQSEASQH